MIRHPSTLALRKAEVNSVMRIAAHSALLFNSRMDIDEIRRQNIRALGDKIGAPTLAAKAGMSLTQFYNLRDGAKDSKTGKPRGMRKETAWRIEEAAGVPRGYLDLPHEHGELALIPPERGNLSRAARPIVAFDDEDPLDEDMVSVPCLALKLSAGSGRLEWEVDHTGKPNRYRRDWIARRRLNPAKLVTVKVTGDSMEPGIPDGASLTLDTSSTSLRTGKRHAIDYMGEFFIKRLFKQPDGSIIVRSDNPDKERHPDWTITHEHGDAIRIMGSVVEILIETDD